jgi:hypothetical protein
MYEAPMPFTSKLLLATALCMCLAASAQAHFLFIRLSQPRDGMREVEVFFSEAAQAGDPMFVDKIAGTRLWEQKSPGLFAPLAVTKATDRLTAKAAGETVSITGQCQYGVLTRDVSFLLRYFPKAVGGDPAALNQLKPHANTPLEIMAQFGDGQITFQALDHGKPVPHALFTTVDDDLNNEELKGDAMGRAVWKPKSPGYYCVYTRLTTPQRGTVGDKDYTERRDFATIAFQWPLAD